MVTMCANVAPSYARTEPACARIVHRLADGATTTVHAAAYRAERTDARVVVLRRAEPLLVRDGRSAIVPDEDPEGFSAASHQFDSDITAGRYPRAALGVGRGLIWAVTCDGRAPGDAGMALAELADFMLGLGAEAAINLDGGGSTSLVCDGALVNRPREQHGVELPEGRPIRTAIALLPRA